MEKKGANKLADDVNKKCKTNLSGCTIMRYVGDGWTGQCSLKMGPDGGIPKDLLRFSSLHLRLISELIN